MNKPNAQLEQVNKLFNDVLYVLQHSYYRGEDAHLVELSKQFIKELRIDWLKGLELEAKQATEAVVAQETVKAEAAPVEPAVVGESK